MNQQPPGSLPPGSPPPPWAWQPQPPRKHNFCLYGCLGCIGLCGLFMFLNFILMALGIKPADAPTPPESPQTSAPVAHPKPLTLAQIAEAKRQAHDEKVREAKAAVREARAERHEATLAAQKTRAEAAARANEYEENGLVIRFNSVHATEDGIVGTIINRSGGTLSYAQVQFNLYDRSGAQIGSAMANINGLEDGAAWHFKASSFGMAFSRWKFSAMSSF